MPDSEFYQIEENWPQPPDDSCTLEAAEQGTTSVKRKIKPSRAKMKKKMSESLAGVTAAAVAVVMVATAIPSLKDAFQDFPELPDFEYYEFCPVCKIEDCPYFAHGDPGLRITLDSDPDNIDVEDIYTMAGFTTYDLAYRHYNADAIFTEEKQRLIICAKPDLFSMLPIIDVDDIPVSHNADGYMDEETAYTGIVCCGEDEKSPMQYNYFHALIVYDDSGTVPQITPKQIEEEYKDFDSIPSDLTYRTREIQGVPNAQLQICSNLDGQMLDTAMDYLEIMVLDDYYTMELGKTMLFAETEDCCRGYNDLRYGGITSHYGFEIDGMEHSRALSFHVEGKEYQIKTGYDQSTIIFYDTGWKAIFDRWRDLNEEAPESGHQVYFILEELNRLTVNGIVYQCYMAYSTHPIDDVNDNQWAWIYLVPQQEEKIAIEDRRGVSPEELQSLLEKGITEDDHIMDILRQITLR
jgi:hypothetical protein